MRGETTCPTCGGEADFDGYARQWNGGNPNDPPSFIHRRYRTTADPARVARLESLLREIGDSTVLFHGNEVVSHTQRCDWQGRIRALLGPADAS